EHRIYRTTPSIAVFWTNRRRCDLVTPRCDNRTCGRRGSPRPGARNTETRWYAPLLLFEFERTSSSPRSAQARRPVRLSSHSVSLSSSWPHLVLECFRGCAAGPRAGRPRAARCEAPTPSWRPDLTLPAVSPVPIAQGVPLIGAFIALSRLTDVAAITGFCRCGLGSRNQGGQSQHGDERLHGSFHPVTDHRPSRIGRRAGACGMEDATGGATVL